MTGIATSRMALTSNRISQTRVSTAFSIHSLPRPTRVHRLCLQLEEHCDLSVLCRAKPALGLTKEWCLQLFDSGDFFSSPEPMMQVFLPSHSRTKYHLPAPDTACASLDPDPGFISCNLAQQDPGFDHQRSKLHVLFCAFCGETVARLGEYLWTSLVDFVGFTSYG